MAVRIERHGDGHLVRVAGDVTLEVVLDVIERIESDGPPNAFIVTDIEPDTTLDLTLDDLHAIARRLRGSSRRPRRNAIIHPVGAGLGPILEDFRTMVSTLSDSWTAGPLEVETFRDRDDAIRWASDALE
ncbi:MAG: hypothetical protein RIB98_01555 [Acidimicrobiales bacterium]